MPRMGQALLIHIEQEGQAGQGLRKFKLRVKKVDWNLIDDATLLLNLYITQLITLIAALVLIWIQDHQQLADLLRLPQTAAALVWGGAFAVMVLFIDLAIMHMIPKQFMDDGGLNERIFKHRALWHLIVICFVVAVCEELLFRGAVQYWLGPYWTSIVFTTLHVRYLRHWLLTGLIFLISYGLGWLYIYTGSLWSSIFAHFVIDFILGCLIKYGGKKSNVAKDG